MEWSRGNSLASKFGRNVAPINVVEQSNETEKTTQPSEMLSSTTPQLDTQEATTSQNGWNDSITNFREAHRQRMRDFEFDLSQQQQQPQQTPGQQEMIVVADEVDDNLKQTGDRNGSLGETEIHTHFENEKESMLDRLLLLWEKQHRKLLTKKVMPPDANLKEFSRKRPVEMRKCDINQTENRFRPLNRTLREPGCLQLVGFLCNELADVMAVLVNSEDKHPNLLLCSKRRIAEASLFRSMLSSAQLPKRGLGHNFALNRYLTSDQEKLLQSLQSKPSTPPLYNTIIDSRIVSNGFKIRIYPSSNTESKCYMEVEQALELREPFNVTSASVLGGIVAEILQLMLENGGEKALVMNCRPKIVVDYFKDEVSRLIEAKMNVFGQAASDGSIKELQFLQQLIGDGKQLAEPIDYQCPHGKQLYYKI